MWTGRLEVMQTGLEGCMCGDGTPPVRGSPPRSDILEAGAARSNTRIHEPVDFPLKCLNTRTEVKVRLVKSRVSAPLAVQPAHHSACDGIS
ncbi:hypothetical protein EYF80_049569 [Liparis tanakae]|uniref:Uncharacterized protein n=1 Tax=Liparis tanakae TaxID=230148 RepID=A0A4Z2FH67_9TELE|nr:hypothetical protein EYF80_049569 [Liparis tanakae]